MTAKEMFEEMGYIVTRNDDLFICYVHKTKGDKNYYYTIEFNLKAKQIKIYRYRSELLRQLFSKEDMIGLYLDDLQAINKQIEELGWEK